VIAELFTRPGLVALVPLLAAAAVASVRSGRIAAWTASAASTAAFLLAALLVGEMRAGRLLLIDPLAAYMAILTAFVGMTTSWFSFRAIAVEAASGRRQCQYHALVLASLGCMLLALLSNNLGVTWAAIEAATLAHVLVVSLPGTAEATEAAWKLLVVGGVGLALALFGTIVLYRAALPVLGPGLPAMSWNALGRAAPQASGTLLNLAFAFLLIGYATLAALAPLNAWMPDACAVGPTPAAALICGALPNVALVVILRLRSLLAANAGAIAPGPPIMALGLASLLLAAFSLWRRGDVRCLFVFASIGQSGIAAFAFGLGGAGAVFAGLLHMTLATLTRSAVLPCAGRAAELTGGEEFTAIGGLLAGHRALGLTLAVGFAGLAGLSPVGVFSSEFLIAAATIQRQPLLALPLGLGLVVGAWALAAALISQLSVVSSQGSESSQVSGQVQSSERSSAGALALAWLHLALVLLLGLAMPAGIAAWLRAIAGAIR
jgi:hydrogenase-4 component F